MVNEAHSLPWGFLFFDVAVLTVLYLLTVWPPYWCRIPPLSFAQGVVYSIITTTPWQKIPAALKVIRDQTPTQDPSIEGIVIIIELLWISTLVTLMVFFYRLLRRIAKAKRGPRKK